MAAVPAAITAMRRPRNPERIAGLALLPLLGVTLLLLLWGDHSIVSSLLLLVAVACLPRALVTVVRPTRQPNWPSVWSLGAYVVCQGGVVAWHAGDARLWPLFAMSAVAAPAGVRAVHRLVLPALPASSLLQGRREVMRLRRRAGSCPGRTGTGCSTSRRCSATGRTCSRG